MVYVLIVDKELEVWSDAVEGHYLRTSVFYLLDVNPSMTP